MTELKRIHVAILFAMVYGLKGVWKHIMGAHIVVVVVCLGIIYIGKLRQPKDPLDIALAKLDSEETDARLAYEASTQRTFIRPTHFTVPEEERGIFMPRHGKYSSLLGGSREQRVKFIQKKSTEKATETTPEQPPVETLLESIAEDAPSSKAKRRQKRAFLNN
ncbi:hypothetical protein SPRG_00017 [Saprolegnia parasitica CBS 223.65]|uniref:Uncharacterized protein n=1 Tax=Saprolegnia parasitica (strain CBS 223.65) TaxID=695850 RepID=A0A067D992_SAPPC|nr:hypothetical protein SPRG_00017 [Saprolegnia parasitica CBS 223.65]KDO35171.1 hypothetical protein SPRG_00017 [Saprolegnia parasitica CBS 223.65]|eukprot:XP_012193523.1 hypothetical protein SPRG_00017 [Saprolegnia parasitica CBS 223.65]